jgi:protein SCO1/2
LLSEPTPAASPLARTVLLIAAFVLFSCSFAPDPLPVLGHVPDFTLTDTAGHPAGLSDLRGRVWVADFIFTRCAGPCPLMSRRMADLQRRLADAPEARLVSVSVDPERDTPEVLREYAARYNADTARWWFLTGEKVAIYDLISKGFLLAVDDGSELPEGGSGPGLITHSVRFVLVDQQGCIRAYYDGAEPGTPERVAADVRRLLAATAAGAG